MKDNQVNDYREWFQKAEEDGIAAKDIVEAGHFFAPACFHLQQMAEKYLKGLLIFHKKEVQRIHDLLQLETMIMAFIPDIKLLHQDLRLLNRYYIETRYPGDYLEFSKEEAMLALESALKIRKFVLKRAGKAR